jgi:hypothetical protein
MLPCTKASDAPGLYSEQPVPSHRRELQTAVRSSTGLTSALASTTVSHIVLASGTYYLSAELRITRSVIIEAAVAGSVVLHAQASSSSPRRVLYINPGSRGVVRLFGLKLTGGYTSSDVRVLICFKISHRPDGKIADALVSTLACATANASVNYTGGACNRDLK